MFLVMNLLLASVNRRLYWSGLVSVLKQLHWGGGKMVESLTPSHELPSKASGLQGSSTEGGPPPTECPSSALEINSALVSVLITIFGNQVTLWSNNSLMSFKQHENKTSPMGAAPPLCLPVSLNDVPEATPGTSWGQGTFLFHSFCADVQTEQLLSHCS